MRVYYDVVRPTNKHNLTSRLAFRPECCYRNAQALPSSETPNEYGTSIIIQIAGIFPKVY
jgi:hypothetical protein